MSKYVLKKTEIDALPGTSKQHFLNPDAQRLNKSLGDLTGLTGFGFHIIDVPPGKESTEYHVHYFEDECTYVLSGSGVVVIDNVEHVIGPGDFIGYPKGGKPHTMKNTGEGTLCCIVVGERLAHDVGDYPNQNKRIYRNEGWPWDLVEYKYIQHPQAGKK